MTQSARDKNTQVLCVLHIKPFLLYSRRRPARPVSVPTLHPREAIQQLVYGHKTTPQRQYIVLNAIKGEDTTTSHAIVVLDTTQAQHTHASNPDTLKREKSERQGKTKKKRANNTREQKEMKRVPKQYE